MENIVTGENNDPRIAAAATRDIPFERAEAFTNAVDYHQANQQLATAEQAMQAQQDEQSAPPITPLREHSLDFPETPDTLAMPPIGIIPGSDNVLPPGYQNAPELGNWNSQGALTQKDEALQRIEHQFDVTGGGTFHMPEVPLTAPAFDPTMNRDLIQSYQHAGDYRRALRFQDSQQQALQHATPATPTDPRVPTSTAPVMGDSWAANMSHRMAETPNTPESGWNVGREITRLGALIGAHFRDIFRADDRNFNWQPDDVLSVVRNMVINPEIRTFIQSKFGATPEERRRAVEDHSPATVSAALDFLQAIQPDVNQQGVSRIDPMHGYFGEFGHGVVPALLYGASMPGQILGASLYSIADLGRYLVGGDDNLYGNRSAYTQYGYRFLQALNGRDLGFTNIRDGSGNRYLAAIDPNAPEWQQWAQAGVGLVADTAGLGWADDAVGEGFHILRVSGETLAETGNVAHTLANARQLFTSPEALHSSIIARRAGRAGTQTATSAAALQAVETGELPTFEEFVLPPLPNIPSGLPPLTPRITNSLEIPLVPQASAVTHNGEVLGVVERQLGDLNQSLRAKEREMAVSFPGLGRRYVPDEIAQRERMGAPLAATQVQTSLASIPNNLRDPRRAPILTSRMNKLALTSDPWTPDQILEAHQLLGLEQLPPAAEKKLTARLGIEEPVPDPWAENAPVQQPTTPLEGQTPDPWGVDYPQVPDPWRLPTKPQAPTPEEPPGLPTPTPTLPEGHVEQRLQLPAGQEPQPQVPTPEPQVPEPQVPNVLPNVVNDVISTETPTAKPKPKPEWTPPVLTAAEQARRDMIDASFRDIRKSSLAAETIVRPEGWTIPEISPELRARFNSPDLAVRRAAREEEKALWRTGNPTPPTDPRILITRMGDLSYKPGAWTPEDLEKAKSLLVSHNNLPELQRRALVDRMQQETKAPLVTAAPPEIWYHGTKNTNITHISPNGGGSSNELGAGLYLTDNEKMAELYAKKGRNSTTIPVGDQRITPTGRVFNVTPHVHDALDANKPPTKQVRRVFKNALENTWNDPRLEAEFNRLTRNERVDGLWLSMREAWNNLYPNRPLSELDYQAFQSRVAKGLRESGYDSIRHDSPTLGRTLVVLDGEAGRLPISVNRVTENVGIGSVSESRGAQLIADSLLHAHYGSDVTGAMVLQSQIGVEADMFDKMFSAWKKAYVQGKASIDDLINAEMEMNHNVVLAGEQRIAEIERTAVDDAVKTVGDNLKIDTDNPCL